ncbi:hypothetical protein HDV00_007712 [Rhizophlyctis rosea]|nr:hypothetical protein HDV00_007712 [Rhizophlyctis rosea]
MIIVGTLIAVNASIANSSGTNNGVGPEGGPQFAEGGGKGLSAVGIAMIVLACVVVCLFLALLLCWQRRRRRRARGEKNGAAVQELNTEALGGGLKSEFLNDPKHHPTVSQYESSPNTFGTDTALPIAAAAAASSVGGESSAELTPTSAEPQPKAPNLSDATLGSSSQQNGNPDSLEVDDKASLVRNKSAISRQSDHFIAKDSNNRASYDPSQRYSTSSENTSTVVGLAAPLGNDERRSSVGTVRPSMEQSPPPNHRDTIIAPSTQSTPSPVTPKASAAVSHMPIGLSQLQPDWNESSPTLPRRTSFGSFATVDSHDEPPREAIPLTQSPNKWFTSSLHRTNSVASSAGYDAQSEPSLARSDKQSRHSSFTSFASGRTSATVGTPGTPPLMTGMGESPPFMAPMPLQQTLTRRRSRRRGGIGGGSFSSKTSITPSDSYFTADEDRVRRISQHSVTPSFMTATEGEGSGGIGANKISTGSDYATAPEDRARVSLESSEAEAGFETAPEDSVTPPAEWGRGTMRRKDSSTDASFKDAEEGYSDEEVPNVIRDWRLSQHGGQAR